MLLTWSLAKRAGGETHIAFSGEITEHADLKSLARQDLGRAVAIDLANVRRLSSAGVRNWVEFLEALGDRRIEVALERCSVVIVQQLTNISQFRGHSSLRSVFAPYYCFSCNVEQMRLVDLRHPVEPQIGVPESCRTCGGLMEFDEFIETYTHLVM